MSENMTGGTIWSKTWKKIKSLFQILIAILFVLACFSVAYWIDPYLFKWFGWSLSGYWAFMVHSIVSMCILGIVVFIMFPIARNKMKVFSKTVEDALKGIAKGDYNVNIKMDEDFETEFGPIVASIHEMAGELGEMEKMRQEFVSNVSHEIQSPLTSIRGFAQVLQNDQLSAEERMYYLQIIETEAMRLSKLSDNLLKLTSLESEHYSLELTTYRLDQQLRNIVLACEPQWSGKQLDMDIQLENCSITADEEMLSQVWVNLINNAIKFTPESGSITITLVGRRDQVEVSVQDSGIGIAEEHISHLFERFFKVDTSRNRSKGGNGLGLSIVHKIVELHGGMISVQSKVGTGSTFVVKLPLTSDMAG